MSDEKKLDLIIFGTGRFYLNRKNLFDNANIVCFTDNDKDKWGTHFENSIIINPKLLKETYFDYISVMVSILYEEQITKQLLDMGIPKEKILNFDKTREKLGIEDTEEERIKKNFFKHNQEPGIKLNRNLYATTVVEPLVSVITPYYNAGKYFEQTFNCVMNQTFPWFEWIIVNDGSTNEEDITVLDRFANKDRRIRIINQSNTGLAGARNTGFQNARTDIVVQIDADDLISPQYIEYIYWGLYFNQDASWAYTWSVGFQTQSYLWRKPWNAELLKTENYLTAFAGIRKRAWEEIGGYRVEKHSYNEDWYFWLNMLSKHKKPVCLGGYLAWYRRTNNGMLSEIKTDIERKARNEELISEIASKADGTVKAKVFPVKYSEYQYESIHSVEWSEDRVVPQNNATRILIIIPWIVMGGADKFVVDVVAGLKKKGYEISIFTTISSNNDWQYRLAEYTDEIYNLPDFLDSQHYLAYAEYYIKSRQINVLMATNSSIGYYMLPYLRLRFPELVIFDYVHMEEWYWRAGGHARTSGALGDVCERTYVCNSATRDVMIECFRRNPDSVKTLYIGVDTDYYADNNAESGYLHNICKISPDRPIVLFPCRLHQQKRPYLMLEIAEETVKIKPEVVFVIVGDGPERAEIQKRIIDKGLSNNIKCIGQSDKMRECYKDAKCTLICSLKEGLALTAYESLAMGKPVVSSDVGGQKDLIDDSVGRLIPMVQSEATSLDKREDFGDEKYRYVEALLDILINEHKYAELSKNCRERIETSFSIKQMVINLDNEIQEMLNDKKLKEERRHKAELLSQIPALVNELYIMGVILG